jgi:hypothetical protein
MPFGLGRERHRQAGVLGPAEPLADRLRAVQQAVVPGLALRAVGRAHAAPAQEAAAAVQPEARGSGARTPGTPAKGVRRPAAA